MNRTTVESKPIPTKNRDTMTAHHANPFASLIDPAAVLAACSESKSLSTLPTHAHHRADLPSEAVSKELAEFDASIDAAAHSIASAAVRKAARKRNRNPGPVERQSDAVQPAVIPRAVRARESSVEPEVHRAVATEARVVPATPIPIEQGALYDWWSAPISWYLRQLTFFRTA